MLYEREKNVLNKIRKFKPDLIIAPYMNKIISPEILNDTKCFLFHAGSLTQRNKTGLDLEILQGKNQSQVTIFEANKNLYQGKVWALENFDIPNNYSKSQVYRTNFANAAEIAIFAAIQKFQNSNHVEMEEEKFDIEVIEQVKQSQRKINWNIDNTNDIIRKINASDSQPGVTCKLLGVNFRLFGAIKESYLKNYKPKQILGYKNQKICISTIDGAIWISQLRPLKNNNKFDKILKLPSLQYIQQLDPQIKEIQIQDKNLSCNDFEYEEKDNVFTITLNMYNGLINKQLALQFIEILEKAKQSQSQIIIIQSKEIFCNGMNLNEIENAEDQKQETLDTIKILNELVKTILTINDKLIISVLKGNASGVGACIAFAADYVIGSTSTIFNVCFKAIGLNGACYQTYIFNRKVGKSKTIKLLNSMSPISCREAFEIGLVDHVIVNDKIDEYLHTYKLPFLKQNFIQKIEHKKRQIFLKLKQKSLDDYLDKEMQILKKNIFEDNLGYEKKRKLFVYKQKNFLNLRKDTLQIFLHRDNFISRLQKDYLYKLQEIIRDNSISIGRVPHLATILVDHLEDSKIYIKKKYECCVQLGINFQLQKLDKNVSQEEVIKLIQKLNQDSSIDGIMVQLPLPKHLNEDYILSKIDLQKDIDGLNPKNLLQLQNYNKPTFYPCTPLAIQKIIKKLDIDYQTKKIVIMGQSKIVGLPLYYMLKQMNPDVQLLGCQKEGIPKNTKEADILIVAIRDPLKINKRYIKNGAMVLDVGIHYKEGEIVGDVNFEAVRKKAYYVNPVPRGVGLMTVAMLIQNLIKAWLKQKNNLQQLIYEKSLKIFQSQ